MHIAIKKLMFLTGFVVGMSMVGMGEASMFPPEVMRFATPLTMVCNDCTYVMTTNCDKWFSIIPGGEFLPSNFIIEKYWNTFEECPKCGQKNWTVKSIPQ